jgi:hypothetical protein
VAFSTWSRSLIVNYETVVSFGEGQCGTTLAMVSPTWITNPGSIEQPSTSPNMISGLFSSPNEMDVFMAQLSESVVIVGPCK